MRVQGVWGGPGGSGGVQGGSRGLGRKNTKKTRKTLLRSNSRRFGGERSAPIKNCLSGSMPVVSSSLGLDSVESFTSMPAASPCAALTGMAAALLTARAVVQRVIKAGSYFWKLHIPAWAATMRSGASR